MAEQQQQDQQNVIINDQMKKLNIALYYCANDMAKAKQMLAGGYKDIVVFKSRFSSSSVYGVFIIFYNKVYSKYVDSFVLLSPDYSLNNMQTNDDWKLFERQITEYKSKIENSRVGLDFRDKLEKGFSLAFNQELTKLLERNDQVQVHHVLQKLIQEQSSLKRVDLSIELQEISSLEMETDSLTTRKLDAKTVSQSSEEKEPPVKEQKAEGENEPQEGTNGIKLIVKGALILSQIKGKHISQVVIGDHIMVSMIETTNQTVQIARAFKAYDEDNKKINPVPGRVVSIKYIDGMGYKIYVIIAKGVLAQILEEETNIKVGLDPAVLAASMTPQQKKAENTKISIPAIVGLAAVILALLIAVVLIVFK